MTEGPGYRKVPGPFGVPRGVRGSGGLSTSARCRGRRREALPRVRRLPGQRPHRSASGAHVDPHGTSRGSRLAAPPVGGGASGRWRHRCASRGEGRGARSRRTVVGSITGRSEGSCRRCVTDPRTRIGEMCRRGGAPPGSTRAGILAGEGPAGCGSTPRRSMRWSSEDGAPGHTVRREGPGRLPWMDDVPARRVSTSVVARGRPRWSMSRARRLVFHGFLWQTVQVACYGCALSCVEQCVEPLSMRTSVFRGCRGLNSLSTQIEDPAELRFCTGSTTL